MEIDPREMWMVGDTEIDVATGQKAGMGSVAVTWGFRSRETLLAAKPDRLVDHPSELLEPLLVCARNGEERHRHIREGDLPDAGLLYIFWQLRPHPRHPVSHLLHRKARLHIWLELHNDQAHAL